MKNLIKTSPPPYTRVRGIIVPAFAAVAGLLFPAVTYADGFDPAEARQTVAQFNEKGGQSQEILSKFSTSARFSLIEDRQEWGEMHLVVDGDTVWRQTDKDHITTPILTFPVDGNRHSVAFCWPAMGPDARIEFTTDDDSTDELKDIYCIELEMTGASSSSINEVEVVYTTDKGDEKTLYFGSLENDDWGTGSDQPLRSAMRTISEADSIVSLKAYDRVEEGMEHRVAVPCRITRPQHAVPVREFMPVYVSESLPDHLNGYGLNYSSVRMISDAELHLSLMDASDGKAISDGVSFSSGSPTADGEGWLFDSESKDGFPEIGTIIKADNYVPIVITNISNTARRAYINGNEYQISGDRIQATVPMYPDKNPGWQFLPLYCVTPSESDADNTTDRYRAYDGEILSVEYDGSNTNEQIRHLKLCVLNRSGKELTSENTTAVAFTDGGYMVFDVTSSDNNTLLLETTDNCPYDGGQEGNLTIFFADKDEWTAHDGDFDHFSESWIKDFFHVKNTGQSLDKYDGTEFNVPTASADPNSVDLSAAGESEPGVRTAQETAPGEGDQVTQYIGYAKNDKAFGLANTQKLVDYLGLSEGEVAETLVNMTYEELLTAATAAGCRWENCYGNGSFEIPFIDSEGNVNPYAAQRKWLIGTTWGEMSTTAQIIPLQDLSHYLPDITDKVAMERLTERYGDKAEAIAEEFARVYPDKVLGEALYLNTMPGDLMSRAGLINQALPTLDAAGLEVYNYLVAYKFPYFGGCTMYHSGDIGYWFYALNAIPYQIRGDEANAYAVSDAMSAALAAFAATGNPSTAKLAWEPWTAGEHNTMVFDVRSELRADHDAALYDLMMGE